MERRNAISCLLSSETHVYTASFVRTRTKIVSFNDSVHAVTRVRALYNTSIDVMSVADFMLSFPCCIVIDLVINMSVVNCMTM